MSARSPSYTDCDNIIRYEAHEARSYPCEEFVTVILRK